MAKKKKRRPPVSRFQKRKAAKPDKPSRFEPIFNYQIMTVPVWGWLVILGFLSPIFCFFYFSTIYEYQDPPVVETFTAEVDTVWTRQRETYGGGRRSYYAKLVYNDEQVTCRIPSQFVPDIVPNRSYEFETSRSRTKCVITAAEDVTLFDLGNK